MRCLALLLLVSACNDPAVGSTDDPSPNGGGGDEMAPGDPGGDPFTPGDDVKPGDAGGGVASTVLITEVLDGTLTGGLPKYVELTNVGDETADLSAYSLGVFVNGNTSLRSPVLTVTESRSVALHGTLAPCDTYVVNFENDDAAGTSMFFDVYGFDPDYTEFDAVFNGDDAIVLFVGPATGDGTDATTVDTFGAVGVDGSNQPWEYVNGMATRNTYIISPPAPTTDPTAFGFAAAEWTFSGPEALEGLTAEQIAAASTPGQHGTSTCP